MILCSFCSFHIQNSDLRSLHGKGRVLVFPRLICRFILKGEGVPAFSGLFWKLSISSIFVSRPAIFRFALAEYSHSSLFLPLQSGGHLIPETYCHLREESDCLQTLFCCFQILERVGFTCGTPIICIEVTPLFHS